MPPGAQSGGEGKMLLRRACGSQWGKPLPERAALPAHEWEKNYREGFSKEMGEKYAAKDGKTAGQSPADRAGASFFKRPPEF